MERSVETLKKNLLRWYRKEGRSFPWREIDDPYKILVSEVLLQKTTAGQVSNIFHSFFEKFPNVRALSEAKLDEIESIIRALGLKKKARFLKNIASHIEVEYAGEVPESADALESLRGVGKYTANAVMCFAFGRRAPVVDTNAARVLRRYYGLAERKPPYQDERIWNVASSILPQKNYREFNFALLDFGAKVCLPSQPSCSNCPLEDWCLDRQSFNHSPRRKLATDL